MKKRRFALWLVLCATPIGFVGGCDVGPRIDENILLSSLVLDNAESVRLSPNPQRPRLEFTVTTLYPATWVLKQYDKILHDKGMADYHPQYPAYVGLRRWINGETELKDRHVWEHSLHALWVFTTLAGAKKVLSLELGYVSASPSYYIDSMPNPTNSRLHVLLIVSAFRVFKAPTQTRTGTAP